jgi:hypothetical protein
MHGAGSGVSSRPDDGRRSGRPAGLPRLGASKERNMLLLWAWMISLELSAVESHGKQPEKTLTSQSKCKKIGPARNDYQSIISIAIANRLSTDSSVLSKGFEKKMTGWLHTCHVTKLAAV